MVIVDENLLIERRNVTELAGAIASAVFDIFDGGQVGVMVLVRMDYALLACCRSGPQGLLLCSSK
jgi:hypothetical protein